MSQLKNVERCIYLYKNRAYRVYVSSGNYIGTYYTIEDARSARDTYYADKDKGSHRHVVVRGLTDRLNEALCESGMGINEISKKTGITTYNLCLYFNEGMNPKIDNLAKLAICLNVSTDWLLGISKRKEIVNG